MDQARRLRPVDHDETETLAIDGTSRNGRTVDESSIPVERLTDEPPGFNPADGGEVPGIGESGPGRDLGAKGLS